VVTDHFDDFHPVGIDDKKEAFQLAKRAPPLSLFKGVHFYIVFEREALNMRAQIRS
jgi:hypothetical protein